MCTHCLTSFSRRACSNHAFSSAARMRSTSAIFSCAARRAEMGAGGVVHSFDGGAAELDQLLDLGLHIGLNGCSLRTADNLAVAAAVPLGRLHLETDAPWCGIKRTHAGAQHLSPLAHPEVKKEKWADGCTVKDRCEPCHIAHVLQVVAGARGGSVDAETVAAAAYENSVGMFFAR